MKQLCGNATLKIIIMNHNDEEYLWQERQAIRQTMKPYINQEYEGFNLTHPGPKKKKLEYIIIFTPQSN
jgi:hypothetical protein